MALFAVLGATGRTGSATARALLTHGHTVRVLTRTPDSPAARCLAALGATLVHADMNAVESLGHAFTGTQGVFSVQPASHLSISELVPIQPAQLATGEGVSVSRALP